uniref:NADH-ubiquinone oxidoreductase chain 4 n=1 Tax=Megachile strupigera TaxID=1735309 RepID=A0A0P0HNH0_9HYME|nr:NADH dehydrogenase subunit 4 [Megachile strupigera]
MSFIQLMLLLIISLLLFYDLYFYSSLIFFFSFMLLMNISFFVDWISMSLIFSLNYYSYGMVILSMWIMSLVYLMMKYNMKLNLCLKLMMFMLLILIMNFMTLNIMWFYIMFEFSLMLIFLLIYIWGLGELRMMAGYYLMFYTLFFSLPLLLILLIMINRFKNSNFILSEMYFIKFNNFLFWFMILSFLVKLPMYMIHGWLLKAHVEAPVYGSMILAAIMLKLGSYGMLRLFYIFYKNVMNLNIYIMIFSLIGINILSLMCLRQIDMKILVALSSVVHMGLMLSSMMTLMKFSFLGAYLIMIAHGLCSSGMFYMLNLCYLVSNSRLMVLNKGLMIYMPSMSLMWFLMCSSNMAVPPSLNLVGEIFLLMSLIIYFKITIIKLFFYCLMSFMYSLYFFSYINHGNYNFMINKPIGKMLSLLMLLFHLIPLNLFIMKLDILI